MELNRDYYSVVFKVHDPEQFRPFINQMCTHHMEGDLPGANVAQLGWNNLGDYEVYSEEYLWNCIDQEIDKSFVLNFEEWKNNGSPLTHENKQYVYDD